MTCTISERIPDGSYQILAVRDVDNNDLRLSQKVDVAFSSSLRVKVDVEEVRAENTGESLSHMIQAKVEGRPSLSTYYYGIDAEKAGNVWKLHWQMLHTGNPTGDARNHPPFYTTLTTQGELDGAQLNKMAVLAETVNVAFCENHFNGGTFATAEVSNRIAKNIHMGEYSTPVTLKRHEEGIPGIGNFPLFELTEEEPGFGAPRHLLCGRKDAKMSYIFKA